MTCRYSETDWRDVLYNSVRACPGNVVDAAAFLTKRRGRSMHGETLRAKLRGVDGDSISLEIAELLTEWMQELHRPDALDWLHAFNARFGLAVAVMADGEGPSPQDAVQALQRKLLQNNVSGGRLAELGLRSIADGKVDGQEADALIAQAMSEVRELLDLSEAVRVASAAKGGAA